MAPRASTLRGRRGFTVVEIMVVLIIIAILAALLLPAIFRAQTRARVARVNAEIDLMSQTLEQFKERYGVYPPSAMLLREDPINNPYLLDPTDTSLAARVDRRTVALFQRMWPNFPILTCQFDFDGDGTIDQTGVDFDGNGVFGDRDPLRFLGTECLVFFLGGMPQGYVDDSGTERLLQDAWASGFRFADVTRRGNQGFSRNPVLPFSRETDTYAGGTVPGANDRFAPLFEFDIGRLIDTELEAQGTPDSDGFWEYLDWLEANPNEPYRYFSSYQGQAYNSVSLLRFDTSSGLVHMADPADGTTPESSDNQSRDYLSAVIPPSFLPYYAGAPFDQSNQIIQSQIQWFNPRSFQIISPGVDGRIGYGGRFNPETGEGPWSGGDNRDADGDGSDDDEEFDADNLTNFVSGPLGDEE